MHTYIPMSPPSWACLPPSLSYLSRSSQSTKLISPNSRPTYPTLCHISIWVTSRHLKHNNSSLQSCYSESNSCWTSLRSIIFLIKYLWGIFACSSQKTQVEHNQNGSHLPLKWGFPLLFRNSISDIIVSILCTIYLGIAPYLSLSLHPLSNQQIYWINIFRLHSNWFPSIPDPSLLPGKNPNSLVCY